MIVPMVRVSVLLPVLMLFAALPAYANEDGAFCASEGYLAYELQGGITPDVNGHVIKVLRFEPQHGIYAAGQVTLEDFQVHEMNCDKNRIKVSGWGLTFQPQMTPAFQQYIIEISDPQNVHVVDHVEDSTRKFDPSKEGPEPGWFWNERQPGVLLLEFHDPNHKYQLVLNHSEKSVQGGFEHFTKAEVTQIDSQGKVSQRWALYQHTFLETID